MCKTLTDAEALGQNVLENETSVILYAFKDSAVPNFPLKCFPLPELKLSFFYNNMASSLTGNREVVMAAGCATTGSTPRSLY